MQVLRHIGDRDLFRAGSVVTLGNFDGVHLGHQALICGAVRDGKERGLPSVVLTFDPHPLKVLARERAPKLILTLEDKIHLLQRLGVDIVAVQTFDLPFARLTADAFVHELLVRRLNAKKLWVGKDLRFGQHRKGGVEDLARWGESLGFEVAVVEPILVDHQRVSSSRVRDLVGRGQVELVKRLLDRYHFVSGRVTTGQRRGKDLGFPTANIDVSTEVLPLDGIYATFLSLGRRTLRSVTSVGTNPTFGDGPRTVETYIMDFSENIYGASVRLSFVQRLRDQEKFFSVQELVAKIGTDVENAEAVLRGVDVNVVPEWDCE